MTQLPYVQGGSLSLLAKLFACWCSCLLGQIAKHGPVKTAHVEYRATLLTLKAAASLYPVAVAGGRPLTLCL